jgi:hypothetical protein
MDSFALMMIAPAGVLDARFTNALHRLHGPVPTFTAYRDFLAELQGRIGPLVEVLAPPLSNNAANAVRRPICCDTWTGDSECESYYGSNRSATHYWPLDQLTARLCDGRVIIETNGQVVHPLYHATRLPPTPWDMLCNLLLHGSPQRQGWRRRLCRSITAFPHLDFVPQISIAGGLVLSAAQWRIRLNRLWSRDATFYAKVRLLNRLRSEMHLPRWVLLTAEEGGRSVPCDLESLRSVHVLEKLVRGDGADCVIAEEMTPSPADLPIRGTIGDASKAVTAELLVRLPVDESPSCMAERIARHMHSHEPISLTS